MPKAPKDGVVEINGTPFSIRAGEDYPEGGKFRDAEPVATGELPGVPPQATEAAADEGESKKPSR